jgi:raffinose/stachyose/melibiose transport system permease protein
MNKRTTQGALTPAKATLITAESLAPVLFLAPSVILLLAFLLYPLTESFALSLVKWNGLGSSSRFVGLANWMTLSRDATFWHALGNNLLLGVLSVLIQLPIALALALMLDKASRGSKILKILYFLPLLFSSVALGVIFKNIFDVNFGAINAGLNALGLGSLAKDWLGDTRYALGSVIAVICWQNIPFYMLDGASPWTIFWRI